MHKIYYKPSHDAKQVLIHDLNSEKNKVVFYEITQSLEKIWSFKFDIQVDHPHYNNIVLMLGMIQVVNDFDGQVEFTGRILQPTARMSANGFTKSFICEGRLSYLNDSTQTYMKFANTGILSYLQNVLLRHNQQVESHKQIHAGNVTVTDTDNYPNNYIDYETTAETMRKLKERFGGVFILRDTPTHLRLDYINHEEAGRHSETVLKLGDNIKSARRSVNFDEVITRLVPVGDEIEQENQEETPDGQQVTRPRTTIESVNGGLNYLEDKDLIRFAGIIQRPHLFEYTETPSELKKKAEAFMAKQALAIATWDVEAVDKYLIDSHYDKLEVGNFHPIDIRPLSVVEELQIVEKVIRSDQPQRPKLTIGAVKQTFTSYQRNPFTRGGI